MIRILGINGSPRKEGKTAALLREVLHGAEAAGAQVSMIHLIDYPIRPCLGFYSEDPELCNPQTCTTGVMEDGMKGLFERLLHVDGVVFASSTYWFGPTGLMKTFLDRLTALENVGKLLDGKVAGFAATCEEMGAYNTIISLMGPLVDMGFVIPPYALVYTTGRGPLEEDPEAIRDARRLGRNMVTLARRLQDLPTPFWP